MAVRELEKIRTGTENRGLREGQSRDMPKTEIRKTKGMRTFRNLVGRQRIQGKSSGKKRGERGAEKSPEPLRDKRWGQRRLLNLGNHPKPLWAVCSCFRQDPNVCLEGSGGRRCWGNTHTK